MLPRGAILTMLALMLTTLVTPGATCVTGSEEIRIMVSADILRAIAYPIVEGVGEVFSIVSGEADPHAFTLTPGVIDEAVKSDLIVVTGHMEWEEELIRRVAEVRGIEVERISLNLLEINGIKILEENIHGFWLLPDNALIIAGTLADKLKSLRPEHTQRISENYEAFRERILRLKDFLASLSEKYNLRGKRVVLGFYEEHYIAEAIGLEADVVLIGEEGMVKPGTLTRIVEEARLGKYSCIVISDVALLMENIREAVEEISRETGCPVAYVMATSTGSLEAYDDIMYYNAGQISSAILSGHRYARYPESTNIYYLAAIILLLIVVVFETMLLMRVRAKP